MPMIHPMLRARERYGIDLAPGDLTEMERRIHAGGAGVVHLGLHRHGGLYAVAHAGERLAAVVRPDGRIKTFLTPCALNPHAARLEASDPIPAPSVRPIGADCDKPEPCAGQTDEIVKPEPESPQTLQTAPRSHKARPPHRETVRRPREFDKALLRIVDGKGSVVRNLVEVTGLTVDSIKSRVKRARYDYEETEADKPVLDGELRRYLAGRYRKSKDPIIRNWMAESVTSPTRKRPDWRSSRDSA